jgi:hypothetical protein
MPGASVILKVGSAIKQYAKSGDQWWYSYGSGGPILNTGQILAGNGGNASQYAAPGGDAIVLGRNTVNRDIIKAGNGGSLSGTGSGEAGKGGVTQIWGKLGGSGHLYNQQGAQALAGHGGNCSSSAQTGGNGGNLWLVSLPNVYLSGGTHKAGNRGSGCTNSQDGGVTIEPLLIDLSNANTEVTGGNVSIYGGDGTILDLSNINDIAINATGDVILAVGDNGRIDLSQNNSSIIKAAGKVYLFSDNPVLMDDGVTLETLINASQIVRGYSKILREVSITATDQVLVGEPNTSIMIGVSLSNYGPEADTYTLNVTNPKAWPLSQLPATLEVPGLSTVDLALKITLSEMRGDLNVITITATSQNDSEVSATATVQAAVAGGTLALANTPSSATVGSGSGPLPKEMHLFMKIYGSGSGRVTGKEVSHRRNGQIREQSLGRLNCKSAHCQADPQDPFGIGCDPKACQAVIQTGNRVILSAEPDAGSMFRGWYGDYCVDNRSMMDGNEVCIAFFAKLHQLTMKTVGPGHVRFFKPYRLKCQDNKCVAQFGHGTTTSLQAIPDGNARFLGWTGDCTGRSSLLSLEIKDAQTCTAHFE